MEGDTLVPRPVVVPGDDDRWPKVAWGYRLGAGVNYLRTQLQRDENVVTLAELRLELEKLGFVRDVPRYKWSEVIMPALRRYYELNGHVDVPQKFVVPSADETWPKASWGWGLGSSVLNIRSRDMYAEQVAASKKELETMGFCFTTIYERDWKERVLPALATHRREFGDCLVHTSFIVPSELQWPEKAWGVRLGPIVSDIRARHSYEKQSSRDREILDSLGFVWDVRAFVWKEQIVRALKVYIEKHGHCRMTASFVVPSHAPWPEKTWGIKLGYKVSSIRHSGTFFEYFGRDAEWLDALDFNMKLSAVGFEKRVAPLVNVYATVTGDQDIPDDFIIPSEDPWPEAMWGVHLGLIVARNAHHLR